MMNQKLIDGIAEVSKEDLTLVLDAWKGELLLNCCCPQTPDDYIRFNEDSDGNLCLRSHDGGAHNPDYEATVTLDPDKVLHLAKFLMAWHAFSQVKGKGKT